jgi:hypothetical protein
LYSVQWVPCAQTVSVAAFEAAAATTAPTLDGASATGGERAAGGGGGDTSEQDGPTLWSVAEDAHPQAGVTPLDMAAVISNADAVVGGALRSKHGLVIVVTPRDSNDVIALERATDECWRFVQVRAHVHTHHAVDNFVCSTRQPIAFARTDTTQQPYFHFNHFPPSCSCATPLPHCTPARNAVTNTHVVNSALAPLFFSIHMLLSYVYGTFLLYFAPVRNHYRNHYRNPRDQWDEQLSEGRSGASYMAA